MNKIDPEIIKKFSIAEKLNSEKKFEEAAEVFANITEKFPNFIPAFYNLGTIKYNLGLIKESIDCFKKCINLNPKEKEFYNNLGKILYESKDYNNSIIYLEKSLQMESNQIATIEFLTGCYAALNMPKKIYNLLKDIINDYPNNKFLNAKYGSNLLYLNQHDKGLDYLKKAYGFIEFNDNEKKIRISN